MTPPAPQPVAVRHRRKPWLGTGLAIRQIKDGFEVQWPGKGLTQHVDAGYLVPGAFPQSWPLPVERRPRARRTVSTVRAITSGST